MKYFYIFLLSSSLMFAQFTTPNTGVEWNIDDLVVNSGGVVTGAFPNYTVTAKVFVSANDKVIIPAGAVIIFTAVSAGFEINGIFQAVGNENDSIIFTSSVPDSTGYYDGFRFNENTIANASIIKYAKIFYATYGMRCISASPVLAHSHLYKCGRGVQLSSSNATIYNNIIERSYEYGITMTLGSSPLIENNSIIKNNTRGVSALNQISIGLQGNNSPVIKNNIIEGGESIPTGGISLWVSGASSFSNAIIEENEIFNNSFGITLYSTSNGLINAIVRDNIIYNNNINPNTLTSGSGINVNGSPFNQPVITRNTIFGNWWGVTIQNGTTVQPGPQPNLGNVFNADTTDDGLNKIFGNIQGTETFDLYNNCTNNIMAQNNDWGVYDSVSIEQNIFHKVDNSNHGLVIFMPFHVPDEIPVELISFTAIAKVNIVSLKWKTATEINNLGFEIERALSLQDWKKIAFIKGKGTVSETSSYSFIDNTLPMKNGKVSYRLKQIDFDGSVTYHQTTEVNIIVPLKFALEQNYPNPFNPETKITFSLPMQSYVTLEVYNIIGSKVKTLVRGIVEEGIHIYHFNAANLTSGVYMYRLTTPKQTITRKMVYIK